MHQDLDLLPVLGRCLLHDVEQPGANVVVLAIAMPLKYAAGMPAVVTHAGRIHGALFVLFVLALANVSADQKWPRRASVTAVIAALLPLGAFWLEREFRRSRFPAE